MTLLSTQRRREEVLPRIAARHSPPQSLDSPGKQNHMSNYPPQHYYFHTVVPEPGIQIWCMSLDQLCQRTQLIKLTLMLLYQIHTVACI